MSVYLVVNGSMPEQGSEDTVRVKIGCTTVNTAESRVSALQTGNPDKLHTFYEVPAIAPYDVETKLHQKFSAFGGPFSTSGNRAALDVNGGTEWFAIPRSEIDGLIEAMDSYADISSMKHDLADANSAASAAMAKVDELKKRHADAMAAALSRVAQTAATQKKVVAKYERTLEARCEREKKEASSLLSFSPQPPSKRPRTSVDEGKEADLANRMGTLSHNASSTIFLETISKWFVGSSNNNK